MKNSVEKIFEKIAELDRNANEVKLATQKVDLALLDDLSNINMEAGSLLVLQKFQMQAFQQLEKSIALNKKGLLEAQRGLKAAQDLGEPRAIEAFERWIKGFKDDIQRGEKGQRMLGQLDNI
jgi:hypothetical protein